MTLNDVIEKIAAELTKEHDKEFGDNIPYMLSDMERDLTMRRQGYEKAAEIVRQTLYKIVSDEIKSKNLDFIL